MIIAAAPHRSSAGGLVGDPLLISAPFNLLAEVLTQDREGSGNSRLICSTAGGEEVADVKVTKILLDKKMVLNKSSAGGLTALLLHPTFLKKVFRG